jgi:hypothetical protein
MNWHRFSFTLSLRHHSAVLCEANRLAVEHLELPPLGYRMPAVEKSVKRKIALLLTPKELSLLRAILGFVEAGEVSGGPLDAEAAQQRGANLRLFDSLCHKIFRAGNE